MRRRLDSLAGRRVQEPREFLQFHLDKAEITVMPRPVLVEIQAFEHLLDALNPAQRVRIQARTRGKTRAETGKRCLGRRG